MSSTGSAERAEAAPTDRATWRERLRSTRAVSLAPLFAWIAWCVVVSLLVATTFDELGPVAFAIFLAPLVFARQLLSRTRSLRETTRELAEKHAENEHQALHDSLTGLPNRELFARRLSEAIDAAERRSAKPMSRGKFGRWLSVRTPEAIVHEGMSGRADIHASAARLPAVRTPAF